MINMEFFLDRKNVEEYKSMIEDYDNTYIIGELKKYLPLGARLLELGMGSGVDLLTLAEDYTVVGSDYSTIFVDDFKKRYPDIEVFAIDAVHMEIDQEKFNQLFDCIYSNKVLQHLKTEDMVQSLINQGKYLNTNGIIFMTLWNGEYREEMMAEGTLRFVYYEMEDIKKIIPKFYEIIAIEYYSEMEEDDSIQVVLRKY